MLTLEVTSGPAAGQSIQLAEELVIGREDAGLVIDDPEISRRHARVTPVDGGVMVEDLGSTNGTFVNGERANEPVTLKESGVIHVGTTDLAVNIPIVPIAAETRVRQVADFEPDVTRARPVADFDPDVTRARDIAPPSDLTAPRAVAQPAEPPQEPPPPPVAKGGGPPPQVIAIAVGVVVAIVILVVLLLL
jgi:predicted component of type VI protein secretion system